MPIQLIITGEHTTDVLAEIQNLSNALGGPEKSYHEAMKEQHQGSIKFGEDDFTSKEACNKFHDTETPKEEPKAEAPKQEKLSRTEQEAAMKEMIEAGKKDERFDLLTKGRAAKVEKALSEEPADTTEDDLSGMFDDDNEDVPKAITSEMIKEKMGQLGKDANGAPIQENLLKIREILTKHIPEGEEIKRGNIPENKIAEVYAELETVGK